MRTIARIVQFSGALTLWLALAAPYVAQSGVRLQGSYEYVVRPDNPIPAFSARYNFDVILAGCSWIISYEDLSASTNANLVNVRATASCDGTNIYFIQYQSESGIKHVWGSRYDSVKNQLPRVVAKIFPGDYPPSEEYILYTMWFAFGANCVLTSSTGNARPLYHGDLAMFYGDTNFFWGYVRAIDESNPRTHLITLRNRGFSLVRDAPDWKVHRLNYGPPYDKGFVEGVGVWRGVTNIGDVPVPNEFEYTAFSPKFKNPSGSPDFERTMFYKCIVTNVETATTGEIPVQLPTSKVFVTDRRLAHEGWSRIDYTATNGWISLKDVLSMARTQNREKTSFESEVVFAASHGHPPGESNWFRYLIWLAIALPPVFWAAGAFWWYKHKQRKAII
jgi:hypothetical protein